LINNKNIYNTIIESMSEIKNYQDLVLNNKYQFMIVEDESENYDTNLNSYPETMTYIVMNHQISIYFP